MLDLKLAELNYMSYDVRISKLLGLCLITNRGKITR